MSELKTRQDVFAKIVTHLRKQGAQAVGPSTLRDGSTEMRCKYRGDNGTACAVGCLIADKHYTAALENKRWWHASVKQALRSSGLSNSLIEDCDQLFTELQSLHDGAEPRCWEGRFQDIARANYVTVPEAT